jgi:hypothetical protein
VSSELGLKGEDIVPPEEEVLAQEKNEQMQMMAMQQMQAQGELQAKGEEGMMQGANTPPKPANVGLGIQEANSMRGMA